MLWIQVTSQPEFFTVKKPQWIAISVAIILVVLIYSFGRTVPLKKQVEVADNHEHTERQGPHPEPGGLTTDSILTMAKSRLGTEEVIRLNTLENSISRGDVKSQQLKIYHQLSHYWGDSLKVFEPYAWYEAEAARLENSEKTLTFAAHLFLDNLQQDREPSLIKWKALQAKDLFERSLKINPENDSARIGLGACYLFGNLSDNPMQGISMIREVITRDSTNVYAQLTLAKGSLISGQYDKAIERLLIVNRIQPNNLEAILMLADLYDRTGDKTNAVRWYQQSLPFVNRSDVRAEIEKRIGELRK